MISRRYYDLMIPSVFFLVSVGLQNYNLGKSINVFTDEGVYLYAAKLLDNGLVPYKDFFLGHPFFLLIPAGIFLNLSHYNINLFHFFYSVWFFACVFPLYFVMLQITKSRFGCILSLILFCTFTELVQWGVRQFDLRQVAMPLLAFALYFIFVREKLHIAGVLLAMYALSTIANLFVSYALLLTLFLGAYYTGERNIRALIRKHQNLLLTFCLISLSGYAMLFVIPSGFNDIVVFQLNRQPLQLNIRLLWAMDHMLNNWLIFAFGLGGSLLMSRRFRLFGLFNILGLLIVIFGGRYFYPHYLTNLAIGLTITAAFLLASLKKRFVQIGAFLLIVLGCLLTTLPTLEYQLVVRKTPHFFSAVRLLSQLPDPVFTFEPLYALYAQKNITSFYYAADMRSLRAMNTNLSDAEYQTLLAQSNTLVLEPLDDYFLTPATKSYISLHFYKVYSSDSQDIFIKKQYN